GARRNRAPYVQLGGLGCAVRAERDIRLHRSKQFPWFDEVQFRVETTVYPRGNDGNSRLDISDDALFGAGEQGHPVLLAVNGRDEQPKTHFCSGGLSDVPQLLV